MPMISGRLLLIVLLVPVAISAQTSRTRVDSLPCSDASGETTPGWINGKDRWMDRRTRAAIEWIAGVSCAFRSSDFRAVGGTRESASVTR